MNKLNKITSILLIQILMLGEIALAGEIFVQKLPAQASCLSPHIFIDSSMCRDILREATVKEKPKKQKKSKQARKSVKTKKAEQSRNFLSFLGKKRKPSNRMLTEKGKNQIMEELNFLEELLKRKNNYIDKEKKYVAFEERLKKLKKRLNSIKLLTRGKGGYEEAEEIIEQASKLKKEIQKAGKLKHKFERTSKIAKQQRQKKQPKPQRKQIAIKIDLGKFNPKNLITKVIEKWFTKKEVRKDTEETEPVFEIQEAEQIPALRKKAVIEKDKDANLQKGFSETQRSNLKAKLKVSRTSIEQNNIYLSEGFINKKEQLLEEIEQAINEESKSSSSLHNKMNGLISQIEQIVRQEKAKASKAEEEKPLFKKQPAAKQVLLTGGKKEPKPYAEEPLLEEKGFLEQEDILEVLNSKKDVIPKLARIFRMSITSPVDRDLIIQLILKENGSNGFDLADEINKEARKEKPNHKAINEIDKFLEVSAQHNKTDAFLIFEYRKVIIRALSKYLKSQFGKLEDIDKAKSDEFFEDYDEKYEQCRSDEEIEKVFSEYMDIILKNFETIRSETKEVIDLEKSRGKPNQLPYNRKVSMREESKKRNIYFMLFMIFPRKVLLNKYLEQLNEHSNAINGIDAWIDNLDWNMMQVLKNIFYTEKILDEQRKEWRKDFILQLLSLLGEQKLQAASVLLRIAATNNADVGIDFESKLIKITPDLDELKEVLMAYYFREKGAGRQYFNENYEQIEDKIRNEKERRIRLEKILKQTKKKLKHSSSLTVIPVNLVQQAI